VIFLFFFFSCFLLKVPHAAVSVVLKGNGGSQGLVKQQNNQQKTFASSSKPMMKIEKKVEKTAQDLEFEEIEVLLEGQKIKSQEDWKKEALRKK
jgi:hypothetical protein